MHQSLAKAEKFKAAYEALENETEKIRRIHKWEAAQLDQQKLVNQPMFSLEPAEGTHKVQMHFIYFALHMHLCLMA